MLASERSVSALDSVQSQRRQQTLGKSKNGSSKPGIRPVKIYVIDPRTVQQRLEAFADQKNQKAKKEALSQQDKPSEESAGTGIEVEDTSFVPVTNRKLPTSPRVSKSVLTSKSVSTKALATIAPRLSSSVSADDKDGVIMRNSVSLQSINAAALGLPVTNGIALIQQSLPSSSLPVGGILFPTVAPIPKVEASAHAAKKRRKVKKRKVSRKRKISDEKEKEAEDAELAYLLKETRTRTGRISRPVSQPHSPSLAPLVSQSANSTVSGTPPKSKKTLAQPPGLTFSCQFCLTTYFSQTELSEHLDKFPFHRSGAGTKPHSQIETSTNPQGIATSVPHPQHVSISNLPIDLNSTNSAVSEDTTRRSSPAPKSSSPLQSFTENDDVMCSKRLSDAVEESVPNNTYSKFMLKKAKRQKQRSRSELQTAASLVPSSAPEELFSKTSSSNVDVVPSSCSIPSSPPSQCQSPGLPENLDMGDAVDKNEGDSPERVCNSPVDPMLLRSRSPFPQPIPIESSLHAVSVSNLSIPEESLCKGELFMDLGAGILGNLENTNLDGVHEFNRDTPVRELFADSPFTPARQIQEPLSVVEVPAENAEQTSETEPDQPSPSSVTPILIESTEDANDGEIFQSTNYARKFLHPSCISSLNDDVFTPPKRNLNTYLPKSPQGLCVESDLSMDSIEPVENNASQKRKSIWDFVKEQIKFCGISQACGEILEMADKMSGIAREQFIPIREEEIERLGSSAPVVHVDTPFFSHLLDLPFGAYVYKEDAGKRKKLTPPPPITTSELSFTGGVEDVEKFLPHDIDLISLPHLTNLDLT